MFAPVPDSNFNVYIRDNEHDWEDVFSETINAHQSNRLRGNENLFLSLSTAVRYYVSSVEDNSFIKVDDGSNPKFKVLEKILVSYMISKYGKRPEKMETIIRVQEINSGKVYAHYYKN